MGRTNLLHVHVSSHIRGVFATQLQVQSNHVGRGGGGDLATSGVRAREPHALDVWVSRQRCTHRRVALRAPDREPGPFGGISVKLGV